MSGPLAECPVRRHWLMRGLAMSANLQGRNRVIAALRTNWPAGALETCVRLEGQHDGWSVSWLAANTIKGWERPAGYCASRDHHTLVGGDELRRLPEDNVSRHLCVFAPDPAALGLRIAAMEERVAEDKERQEHLWQSMRRYG